MKRYNTVLMLLFVNLLWSCYKDDSTAGYKTVNPIIIENSKEQFELFSLDTLEIKPLVYKEGLNDDDLEFKWTMYGPTIAPIVVANTMSLKIEMAFTANTSPYRLIYEVKDKISGIAVQQQYSVTVNSPFGTGLIVCHSEDNGKNSDVSLIRSPNYQYGFEKDTVMSNLFSRVNNRQIEGVITGAVSTQYQNFATLTIISPTIIERVDPRDYKFIDSGKSVFVIAPENINGVYIVNSANTGEDILNNGGKVHVRSFSSGNRLYGYPMFTPDMSKTDITKIYKPYWEDALCFDALGGRFLYIDTYSGGFLFLTKNENDKFGWNEFKDYECLSMSFGKDKNIHCVMRHKTTKSVTLYSFVASYSNTDIRAIRKLELSTDVCPEIDKAILFEGYEKGNLIYYATKDKIYAMNYSTSTILSTLEYETLPGEEITTMSCWSNYRASGMVNYTNPNPDSPTKVLSASSQNRILVISTYDKIKNEGVIRNLPIQIMPTGTLDKNREMHIEFSGFGKISVTQFQEK